MFFYCKNEVKIQYTGKCLHNIFVIFYDGKATLLYNMSGFQYIGRNIFNMNGFVGPAARTGTFAEIPLRSNIRKETVK